MSKQPNEPPTDTPKETKEFHILDILHVITGKNLATDLYDSVYDLLGWMLNATVDHLTYPSAMEKCRKQLELQHPILMTVDGDIDANDEDEVELWKQRRMKRLGESLHISKVPNVDAEMWREEMQEMLRKLNPKPKKKKQAVS